jgi:major membrane immunogen (membrane-anchored lipoprotein)
VLVVVVVIVLDLGMEALCQDGEGLRRQWERGALLRDTWKTAEDDDDDEDEKDLEMTIKEGKKTAGTGLMSPEPPRNSTCPQGAES